MSRSDKRTKVAAIYAANYKKGLMHAAKEQGILEEDGVMDAINEEVRAMTDEYIQEIKQAQAELEENN